MVAERLQVILEMVAGQYKREARQAASATGQISASAATAGTATGKLGKTMKTVASGGLLAIGAGAVAAKTAFDGTVGAFANFDAKMNESLAIMGDVSDGMREEMSDAAREVAKVTTFSADQAAESYFFLASAGLDAEQSIAAMPQVAKFAQAGMFDMALATDLATDAQSALGLTVDDSAKNLENLTLVTDVLVKANTLANASVQQFSEALTSKAGAALKVVGKDIEEGVAVLAAFADQGIKGAEAGTALNIVLRDLQTKAIKNREEFEKLGIAVFDQQGEMRNIADVVGDVESALGGMSDEAAKAALQQLGFSDKSVIFLQTLLGTSEAIREYEGALRDAGGTTEEVADKQLESAKAQWDLFLSSLKDIGIEIGETVMPALLELLPVLKNMAATVETIIGPIVQLKGVYDDVVGGFDRATQSSNDFEKAFGILGKTVLNSGIANWRLATAALDKLLAQMDDGPDRINGISTGLENHSDALRRATSGYGMLRDNVGAADSALRLMAKRGKPAADAIGEVEGAAETATPDTRALAEAVAAVHENMLKLADPAFRAADAMGDYRDALASREELAADPEASSRDLAEADLAVAEAALEAQAALSELGSGNVSGSIQAIADALGVPYSVAQDLLETLDLIDGKVINTVVDVSIDPADKALLNSVQTATPTGNVPGASPHNLGRAHGGPVKAGQFYRVGEGNRPELMMIPGDNGRVFSNADTKRLISGLTQRPGSSQIVINMEGTGVAPVDAQRVGAMASVMRRMETL